MNGKVVPSKYFYDSIIFDKGGTLISSASYNLTVGVSGIRANDGFDHSRIEVGSITSNSGSLNVTMGIPSGDNTALEISAVIKNSDSPIGLSVTGGVHRSYVELTGDRSNTFTGDTVVKDSALILSKSNSATAINGNIRAINSIVGILASEQISDASTVTLDGSSMFYFSSRNNGDKDVVEKLHRLVVNGDSILSFNGTANYHYKRRFYLNDLEIGKEGRLTVTEWAEGRDRILVRKDSENLATAFERIVFQGYGRDMVRMRSFDDNYWEIYALLPEPTTYGACLAAFGAGVFVWRQGRRSVMK